MFSKKSQRRRIKSRRVNKLIAYGRGANALVRQAAAEGVSVTADVCQQAIDGFFNKFPKTRDYVEACHAAVMNPGYVETAYGRRRYFYPTDNEALLKAYEREATNMPIQGTTGDALSLALVNLQMYRNMTGMKFKIILPVHDAIFLDVPVDEAVRVADEVLPRCMRDLVLIPNTKLYLDVDVEMCRRWGEKMKREEAIKQALIELKVGTLPTLR